MRMPAFEMGEYGVLPETDPFIVVVCSVCKAAVKPQGLRKHIHRHNSSDLANLITPCSVSVSALKFDPKAENSNSSTSNSSGYNVGTGMGGGLASEATSSSSTSGETSTAVPESFQDFSAITGRSVGSPSAMANTTITAQIPATGTNTLPSKSSSPAAPKGGKPMGTLKMKLSKTGLKSTTTTATTTCSSSSSNSSSSFSSASRSVSESPSFLANESIRSALRSENSAPPLVEPLAVPGKKLSLKEREYDPNKHCGVILVDTGKHCTRTLTCKSHALSLRRQVSGRSMSFDQLLSDHRAMRALMASGKALPPPATTSSSSSVSSSTIPDHMGVAKKRELRDSEQTTNTNSPEPPPAKKLQLERSLSSHRRHNSSSILSSSSNRNSDMMNSKADANGVSEQQNMLLLNEEPFREEPPPPAAAVDDGHQQHTQEQQYEIKPFHENGYELHGGGQLVAAANGGYFLKSEPQLATGSLELNGDEHTRELKGPSPPSIITVPLTMLANVVCVNGRNCILEPPPLLDPDCSGVGDENENVPGVKGRHVVVEATAATGGEKRRYLTLSSGRQQRANNRLRLNVIRTEVVATADEKKNGDGAGGNAAAQEYPGIDTWFHQIPKPTYVNCFKLCKLGSSAVLSKRYLNIRKSLIMNMASAASPTGGNALLNRSNSQTVAGGSPVGGVDKVNNFNVERIKV